MTGRRADRFTCGRRARTAASLGERGRGAGLRVGAGARARRARRIGRTWRQAGGDVETEGRGPARGDRGRKKVAQRAVRRMNSRAGARRVRFDVRGSVRAGDVEAGVRPRGGARQQELEQGAQQPEGARPEGAPGHAGHAGHAGVRTSFRTTTAPTSTSPYMHTISGPVGRSPASDSHRPRIEASAPEPHEIYVSRFMSRVKRNAITAGTTRKLKTISTPATGTASVITTPNDR